MVVRLEHDMLLSSKMRIYIITHINNFFADTPHNHGGLTNGYKKGMELHICPSLLRCLEKPWNEWIENTAPSHVRYTKAHLMRMRRNILIHRKSIPFHYPSFFTYSFPDFKQNG